MSWIALGVGTAVAVGGAAYSASQQKKAASQQREALASGTQEFDPTLLGDPDQIDTRAVNLRSIDQTYDLLPYARRLSDQINAINYSTAARYYRKIQPEFFNLQRQIGQNALSASRGELPDDVAAEIGTRAAERGIQGGFGFGSQGAQTGALANLNLRNLGLTSLDQQRYGNTLGLQVNQAARTLLPQQLSPLDLFLTPQNQLQAEMANVTSRNQFMLQNNQLQNNAALQNTSLQNSLNQSLAAIDYQSALQQAQAIAAGSQALGGALSAGLATMQAQPTMATGAINNPTGGADWRSNASSVTTPRLY